MAPKFVYSFNSTEAEGRAEMKALLGGKGANLAEMSNLGIPVPPGFTISTEVCALYNELDGKWPNAPLLIPSFRIAITSSTELRRFSGLFSRQQESLGQLTLKGLPASARRRKNFVSELLHIEGLPSVASMLD